MKINLDKNFTKCVSSKNKAVALVNKIAAKYNDRVVSYSSRKAGKYLFEARGEQKNFKWIYNGHTKKLYVNYTDGRPLPKKIKPKNTYYIIWVEGLTARRGEKIKSINSNGIKYTLKMAEALRVKEKDLPVIKGIMKNYGIADWVINNSNTYFKTHYVPKGTLFGS